MDYWDFFVVVVDAIDGLERMLENAMQGDGLSFSAENVLGALQNGQRRQASHLCKEVKTTFCYDKVFGNVSLGFATTCQSMGTIDLKIEQKVRVIIDCVALA